MHHRHHRHDRAVVRSTGFLLLSSIASLTAAQSAVDPAAVAPLDPVVVTASRAAQRLSDVLPTTTVITRAEIEDRHAPDLATLLRGQPGFDVAQSGGVGSQTSLFLRGANSNQVLVLVDGLRINAAGSGAAAVAHLMADQIDHIEIVRGNVSSLYGSEAIGGVIQIFTRAGVGAAGAGTPSVGAGITWGSERTRAASLDASGGFGPADARTRVGVAASYRGANGFSAIDAERVATANPDFDGYRNRSVSATVAQSLGEHEVGVRYFESHGNLDFDESSDYRFIDPGYDGRAQTHQERSRQTDAAVYGRVHANGFWDIDLLAGQARDLSVNRSSNPFSFVTGSTTSTDRQYRIANTVRIGGDTLTFGAEHLDQSGFSTAYGNGGDGASFSRKVDSVMAGYTGALFLPSDLHEFQFNARHDRYSDFGGATTGLAAYGLKFARGWKAIVQGSTAFKAPSFNELYFPFFGNPALQAERARSVELGLQFAQADTLVRASLFRTRTRDLIVYDPGLSLANNVDRARTTGIEITGRTVVAGWDVGASLTFARPIDEGTGERLLRRAGRNGSVTVAKGFGPWRFTADVEGSGRRFDTDIVTFGRKQLAGYGIANAGVRYTLLKGTTLGVAVTNAFDRRYVLVDGYHTAGRVTMLTLATRY